MGKKSKLKIVFIGRFLYEEYFSREQKLYITGLSIIRNRIGLPAEPYQPVALNLHHIVQDYSPTLPAEPNFLDEETKEEFIALQVTNSLNIYGI